MSFGLLRYLSDTFAFHASPELFLSRSDSSTANSPLRVRLLNRDVAVVSSYRQIQAILETPIAAAPTHAGTSTAAYSASEAYSLFMAPFSPGPNLLLSDGEAHTRRRGPWDRHMHGIPSVQTEPLVKGLARGHFAKLVGSTIDLYSSMKQLAAKLLLGLFLGLDEGDSLFAEILFLQEQLLRGQFSMFPVSIDVGLWRSSRKTGLDAMRRLQELTRQRLRTMISTKDTCPFSAALNGSSMEDEHLEDMTNHVMLFTSSLAIKALASLLTALLLNILSPRQAGHILADELDHMSDDARRAQLHGIQLETERLSPPIIGIMRRAIANQDIPPPDGSEDSAPHIHKGSDVWLYFVRAGRDKSVFGPDAETFRPERFLQDSGLKAETLAFSIGSKSCLGRNSSRLICRAVVEVLLDLGVRLHCQVEDRAVQAWLGWSEEVSPEDWEKGIRQLPVQHPRKPVMVRVTNLEPQ